MAPGPPALEASRPQLWVRSDGHTDGPFWDQQRRTKKFSAWLGGLSSVHPTDPSSLDPVLELLPTPAWSHQPSHDPPTSCFPTSMPTQEPEPGGVSAGPPGKGIHFTSLSTRCGGHRAGWGGEAGWGGGVHTRAGALSKPVVQNQECQNPTRKDGGSWLPRWIWGNRDHRLLQQNAWASTPGPERPADI